MKFVKEISNSWSNVLMLVILTLAFVTCKFANAEMEAPNNGALGDKQNPLHDQINSNGTVSIRKCCPRDHMLVEYDFGQRSCQLRSKYVTGNIITMLFPCS